MIDGAVPGSNKAQCDHLVDYASDDGGDGSLDCNCPATPRTCTISIYAGQITLFLHLQYSGLAPVPPCHTWVVVKHCDNKLSRYDVWHDESFPSPGDQTVKLGKHLYKNMFDPKEDQEQQWKDTQTEWSMFFPFYLRPASWKVCTVTLKCPCGEEGGGEPGCCALLTDEKISSYPHKDDYSYFPGPNSNTFVAWVVNTLCPELKDKCKLPFCAVGTGFDDP